MKMGIITFTEGYNYGNKLQNYALLSFLINNFDGKVYTVDNKLHQGSIKDKFIIRLKWMIPSKKHFCYWKKLWRFSEFNKKYLNFTKTSLRDSTQIFNEVDIFVCGSDQIWNPHYYHNIDKLCGSLDEAKRSISYAASFGINELPENSKESFRKSLEHLEAISLREPQGQEICKNLGFFDTKVHIDPTMLLSPEEWSTYAIKPKVEILNKYVLTYFLGEVLESVDTEINKFCEVNNCERIDLNSVTRLKYYCITPFEFIYLVKNSEMIFTDSFHASVFSILFAKKFLVCNRVISKSENMNSRIINLVDLFKLSNNVCENFNGNYQDLVVDIENRDSVLDEERKRTIEYFKKYLKGVE